MALLGSSRQFLKQGRDCPECGRKFHKGDTVLVSMLGCGIGLPRRMPNGGKLVGWKGSDGD